MKPTAKEKLVEELKAEALRPNPDFKAACSTDAALALRVDRLIDPTSRLEEQVAKLICERDIANRSHTADLKRYRKELGITA